jgi:hypothetical protein
VFYYLRVQQVKVQLVLILAVSYVTLTIDTGVLFSDKLVRMTTAKLLNLAIGDLLLRNSRSKILQNTTCRR